MDLDQTSILNGRLTQLESLAAAAKIDTLWAIGASVAVFTLCFLSAVSPLVWSLAGTPIILAMVVWLVCQQIARRPPPIARVKSWENLVAAVVGINGLSWGLLGAYAVSQTSLDFALAVVAISGVVATIKITNYVGSSLPTSAFAAGALVAPGIAFSLTPSLASATAGAICLIMVFAIYFSARRLSSLALARFVAEADNKQIRDLLDQRRNQVEKLNVALKTNQDKRDQAEATLRRTAADLGLAEGKARALATTLERVSPLCQVTGLANRKHFDDNLDAEWRRAMREGLPVSLLLIDLDEFDAYADAYGSQSADTLLKRVGQSVKGFGRRAGDMAGRYDDSILALLLPRCDVRNAMRMAEALRKRIESSKIAHAGAKNRDIVTAHVAVATTKPGRGLPTTEILKRADTALYEARFQGGNKVVAYQPLSKLKLVKWDPSSDGQLSEQTMTQKLLVWGYDTEKRTQKPDEPPYEHASEHDTVVAVLTGELILEVEGHTMALKSGDCIFVPHGTITQLKVTSDRPSIIFTAIKAD